MWIYIYQKEDEDTIQKFSIIIPNYKTNLSYIKKAFESIANQNYPLNNLEVIFVEDNSPKSYQQKLSKMILEKFSSRFKINIILRNSRVAVGAARNQAIENAEYDYLILLDSDDFLSPNICYYANKMLNKKKYNLIYTDQNMISSDGRKILGIKRKEFLHKKMKEYFGTIHDPRFHSNFIHHAQIISKKAFKKVGGYDENIQTAEDVDLLIKITDLGIGKVGYIPKILYNYRVNASGLTRKKRCNNLRDFDRVLRKHLEMKGFKISKVKHWKRAGFASWFNLYGLNGKLIKTPYTNELTKKNYYNYINLNQLKLIVMDYDNVVIKPRKRVPKVTQKIFKKIRRKKIILCICSGRGYVDLERISKNIGLTKYFIGEVGAVIKFKDKYICLKKKESQKIRKVLRGIVNADGRKVAVKVEKKDFEKAQKILKDNRLDVSFQKNVSEADIVPAGIDKGVGLRYLIKKLGIKKNQVMAIGDFLNDLPMFREAGISVAVANSHPKVKREADLITNRTYGLGVYETLSNLINIKPKKKS
jgi:phosphoglycolate phosphatase (TIGR01487 family)